MIQINAIHRLPESSAEINKPLHLEIDFDARDAAEMTNALMLLANSIGDIVKSSKEGRKNEHV